MLASLHKWEQTYYTASDGLKLACRRYGWEQIDAPAVVCLPGLTRNAADFHLLAHHLAYKSKTPRRMLVFDYRGRGRSEYDANWENYAILTEADDIIQGVVANGIGNADFIGTSRGGLIIMVLAAMKPAMIGKVVLNDIGPQIEGTGLMRIKNMIEGAKMSITNWSEAVEALKMTGARDFPTRDDEEWEEQARLIYREENGKIYRDHDPKLANLMRSMDIDQPIPTLWPQFEGLRKNPLLLIRGANSDLISTETIERMSKVHDDMKTLSVEHQGHAPDLGSADLPLVIERFLDGNKVPETVA